MYLYLPTRFSIWLSIIYNIYYTRAKKGYAWCGWLHSGSCRGTGRACPAIAYWSRSGMTGSPLGSSQMAELKENAVMTFI